MIYLLLILSKIYFISSIKKFNLSLIKKKLLLLKYFNRKNNKILKFKIS